MNAVLNARDPSPGGIGIYAAAARDAQIAQQRFLAQLEELGLAGYVRTSSEAGASSHLIRFQLLEEYASAWAPDCDTTVLCERIGLHSQARGLEREILLSMLLGPVAFGFPSHDELAAAIRVRRNIVAAARRTALAFDTREAERPGEYWTYDEDRGFTVLPGKSLVTALQRATQPGASGKLYSFSCYRATEYVILLGIAQELAGGNPELFRQLQRQWETQAIKSGKFHDVFLREYGSMISPLPPKYYVPGDRLWFRNPDEHSSDASGYEGSWVFYLGGGLFTNFWQRDKPYTLTAKCLELFHWRHAAYRDGDGELRIDESIVEERVQASMQDPAEAGRIVREMLRYREPKGMYGNGGCIDTSREYPRWVCPGTSDLVLPGH